MNIVTLNLCMFVTFLLQIVVAGDEVEVHSNGSMCPDTIVFCSLPACSCFVILFCLVTISSCSSKSVGASIFVPETSKTTDTDFGMSCKLLSSSRSSSITVKYDFCCPVMFAKPVHVCYAAFSCRMEFSEHKVILAMEQKDEDNVIGRGGYGTVYKGILHHTEVAVKFLSPVSFDQQTCYW